MKTIDKVVYPSSPDISRDKTYKLEERCLNLLDKNYKCICEKKSRHFPVIQDKKNIKRADGTPLGIGPYAEERKAYTIALSHCGECLSDLFGFDKNNHSYKITNLDEQLNCIISNLKKSNIKHLDMHPSGKNMCISSSNTLALIDFGVAAINNNFISDSFVKLRRSFGYHYYVGLKKVMVKIIMEKNLLPND